MLSSWDEGRASQDGSAGTPLTFAKECRQEPQRFGAFGAGDGNRAHLRARTELSD